MRSALCGVLCLVLAACGEQSPTSATTIGNTTVGSDSSEATASAGTSDSAGSTDSSGTTSSSGTTGSSTAAGTTDSNGSTGSSSGGTANGSPSNDSPTAGATDAGTSDTGGDVPGFSALQPLSLALQTLEEVPVSGLFDVESAPDSLDSLKLTYRLVRLPMHGVVTFAADSRQFTYEPEKDFFGDDEFVYSTAVGSEVATVSISVINVNDPPLIMEDIIRVVEQGEPYTDIITAKDADNDPIRYTASNLPSWMTLDEVTGVLLGTPEQDDVGVYEQIVFTATDPTGATGQLVGVQIEVEDVNDPPTINISQFPENLDAGEAVLVNIYPDDPDDDPVELSVDPNENLSIEIIGDSISLIANEVGQVTNVDLVISARDALGLKAEETVPLTIFPLNDSGKGRTLKGKAEGEGVHLVVLPNGRGGVHRHYATRPRYGKTPVCVECSYG